MAGVRGASGSTVAVQGLGDLIRDLGKADKSAKRGLQLKLRAIALLVAERGKRNAEAKGLAKPGNSGRGRGKELAGIKPFFRGASAGVRSGATRDGYSYPSRHEYEGRGTDKLGRRAYLNPALDEESKNVELALGGLFDQVAAEGGFTGSSLLN